MLSNKRIANELLKLSKALVSVNSRHYTRNCAGDIAAEVITEKESKGWTAKNDKEMALAKEIEEQLAKFNIGYIDDMNGSWGFKTNGSKFFK